MVDVKLTQDRQQALRDAAALLSAQAEGLRRTGSANTVEALERYAATLEALSKGQESVSLSAEQRTHVEQAQHILEGLRDGLFNADFEKRGDALALTVRRLDEVVTEFNTAASED